MSLFELTSEESQLASTARAYLADFADNTYLNLQQESELGYELERWEQMGRLGWTGVMLPERVGGAGGTIVDAALITRECGRFGLASPLVQTLRVGALLELLDGEKTYDDILAALAEGAPATVVSPPDRTLSADVVAGGYRLSGAPVVVEWVEQSEFVVVLVPISTTGRWLCAVLGPDAIADVSAQVPSVDNERSLRLDLDGFVLPRESLRADDLEAHLVERALARADLLRASSMVGGCAGVLERTTQYALERHQFGQPIGGFQAVRHHLARMVIATDGARLLCDDALTRDIDDDGATSIAAAAVFAAGRAYVQIVLTAAQVHGGIGTTVEHVLHHHFRRAKAMQLRSGRPANRLRELHDGLVVRGEGSLW